MNSTNKQIKKRNKNSYFFYNFVKITGAIPTILYIRTKVIPFGNTKPSKIKGGVLISANHVSFIDPVIIHCVFSNRKLHCLATKELFSSKLKNFFFTQMHCIKVDKDNFSMNSFHEVRDLLKADKAVVIFPEGQVNHEVGEVLAFKSGAILMAHQSNKPILPVYIVKREKWYHRQKVIVGDPVDIRSICGMMPTMDQLKKANDILREKEIELMEFYLKGENHVNE